MLAALTMKSTLELLVDTGVPTRLEGSQGGLLPAIMLATIIAITNTLEA